MVPLEESDPVKFGCRPLPALLADALDECLTLRPARPLPPVMQPLQGRLLLSRRVRLFSPRRPLRRRHRLELPGGQTLGDRRMVTLETGDTVGGFVAEVRTRLTFSFFVSRV